VAGSGQAIKTAPHIWYWSDSFGRFRNRLGVMREFEREMYRRGMAPGAFRNQQRFHQNKGFTLVPGLFDVGF
jgi:hypothetical protein